MTGAYSLGRYAICHANLTRTSDMQLAIRQAKYWGNKARGITPSIAGDGVISARKKNAPPQF
ncbi:hypothetical protein LPB140_11115 [Sphingorhabdus lutea]|uniref:Uncharacterized protein n=1 Tax=Sphingorhabdus lutea TaxID=1913578 RepID=A0A1L3JDP0_9SPHN|nr:hypothetical protein [Sphingorhabdus lutea]APG63245.1 hypothetical protein LPB140_11115 [Sphingorhabdus lutea]